MLSYRSRDEQAPPLPAFERCSHEKTVAFGFAFFGENTPALKSQMCVKSARKCFHRGRGGPCVLPLVRIRNGDMGKGKCPHTGATEALRRRVCFTALCIDKRLYVVVSFSGGASPSPTDIWALFARNDGGVWFAFFGRSTPLSFRIFDALHGQLRG